MTHYRTKKYTNITLMCRIL